MGAGLGRATKAVPWGAGGGLLASAWALSSILGSPALSGGQVMDAKLLWGEASASSLLALHPLERAGLILHCTGCREPQQLCRWAQPQGREVPGELLAVLLPPTTPGDW